MDAGIVDTINHLNVRLTTDLLDKVDHDLRTQAGDEWFNSTMARTLMEENGTSRSDRIWLAAQLMRNVPGATFDGEPADGDWDNLFSHFRTHIQTRREASLIHQ
jgi:hypothetical protein